MALLLFQQDRTAIADEGWNLNEDVEGLAGQATTDAELAPGAWGLMSRRKRRAAESARTRRVRATLYWFTQTIGDFFSWACCCLSSRAAAPRETSSACGKSEAGLSPWAVE